MIAKTALVALLSLATMAFPSDASPVAVRSSSPSTVTMQGILRVIQYDMTNQVIYNQTAELPHGYLQINNNSFTPWTITVPTKFSEDNVYSRLHSSGISCLTAHKLTGNSYLTPQACPDASDKPLSATQLKNLDERQLWNVQQFDNGNHPHMYLLSMYGAPKEGVPTRTNVKVLDDNQHVHLDTEHSQLDKRLYFIGQSTD